MWIEAIVLVSGLSGSPQAAFVASQTDVIHVRPAVAPTENRVTVSAAYILIRWKADTRGRAPATDTGFNCEEGGFYPALIATAKVGVDSAGAGVDCGEVVAADGEVKSSER